jgi:hypothetical protein
MWFRPLERNTLRPQDNESVFLKPDFSVPYLFSDHFEVTSD